MAVVVALLALLAALLLAASAFSAIGVAILGDAPGAPTIDALIDRCRRAEPTGWAQIARAQREVHAAMPHYGLDNGFDTPRQALARGRGYCWQRAAVLQAVLRGLGIEATMVHAFLNRFEGLIAGHVWLVVTVDGEARWVCPGDPRNTPGVVRFTPLTRVRRWGPGLLALSYLGSPIANLFAFVVHLARRGPPLARGVRAPLRQRARRCGLWPLAPIVAWNLALAPWLPPLLADDHAVPGAILAVEAIGRAFVLGVPLVLEVGAGGPWQRRGLALLVAGALAYFASWLPPLADPTPSWLWLGPSVLPAIWLAGLGLMARSGAYLTGAAVFAVAHAIHGVLVLRAALA